MKTFMLKALALGFIVGFSYTQIYAFSPVQPVEEKKQTQEEKESKVEKVAEESNPSDQRIILIDVKEPAEIIIRIKTMDQKRIQDAGIPRFVLTDRENKFAFGIGGVFRGTAGSEFGGIVNVPINEGMQPSHIPISYNGLPHSQLRMSASTSQIFFKMVGTSKRVGNIETFVSMDFHGNNYTPRLRQAYLKLGGFTIGQTWSTMADVSALPPTIDFDGPISMVANWTPLIRYDRSFSEDRFEFAAALEYPAVNATYSPNTNAIIQSIPNVVGLFQYNWGHEKKSHLRLSGVLRNMSYYDKTVSSTKIEQGWGVQLTSAANLCRNLKFFGQAIYGYGIAGYMNDPSNLNVDLLPISPNSGHMEPLETWGCTAGLQYNINKDLFTSVSYSYNGIDKGDIDAPDLEVYKYAQYLAVNVFWTFIDDCAIAVEYLRGSRMTFSDSYGKANRINLLAQYTF